MAVCAKVRRLFQTKSSAQPSVKEVTTYQTWHQGRPVLGGLNDPALGVIDIFLVPIGPLEDGNGYQAVFT